MDTMKAFEISEALEPDRYERGMERLMRTKEGRTLLARRPNLKLSLADRDALARLPAGSLGRAYLDHLERWSLSPTKLVELMEMQGVAGDGDVRWFAERHVLSHDIRHVLSGYDADPLGETLLLWFSYGLEGGRANRLLMIGAAHASARRHGWSMWVKLIAALRRGRRARRMTTLPFEDLLARPLQDVRALAGLATNGRPGARAF